MKEYSMGRVLSVVIAMSFASANAQEPPIYSTPQFATGANPGVALASADFNGDGHLDLATAISAQPNVAILLGDGIGGFLGPQQLWANQGTRSVSIADLDLDGFPDLACALENIDYVSVYRNDGVGSFHLPDLTQSGGSPRDVDSGDIDVDGRPDLVIANQSDIALLRGDGSGGFLPALHLATTGHPLTIEVADINADGKVDLITSTQEAQVCVAIDGAFGFAPPAVYAFTSFAHRPRLGDVNSDTVTDIVVPSGSGVTVLLGGAGAAPVELPAFGGVPADALDVADVNGDGRLDVAAKTLISVVIHHGAGTGAFLPAYAIPMDDGTPFLREINHDGRMDLLAMDSSARAITVLLGRSSGGFTQAPLLGTSLLPRAVVIMDIDSDGDADIVSAQDSEVACFEGDGTGGFSAPVAFPAGIGCAGLAVGDLNGDGKSDLAVANEFTDDVSLLWGDGQGGFSAPVNRPVADRPTAIATADFNGDQKADLVVGTQTTVSYLLGLGNGSFANPLVIPAALGAKALAVGDLNGDGRADVACVNESGKLQILFSGTAHLVGSQLLADGPTGACGVALGDMTEDGVPDIVVSGTGDVMIYRGNGSGGFHEWSTASVGEGASGLALGDVDRDGHLDAVITNYGSNDFSVLLGNGAGQVAGTRKFQTFTHPRAVALGDLDGDSGLDAVVANYHSLGLSVHWNQRTEISFGAACVGSGGYFPAMHAPCCPVAGQDLKLSLMGGLGGSTALVFFGLTQGTLPLPNGCALALGSLLPVVLPVPLGGTGPGAGALSFASEISTAMPAATLTLQAIVLDSGVVSGISSTNALEMHLP